MALRKSPVRLDWIDPAACTLDYRLKIIGRLSFFKHLPQEAIKDINQRFHDRSYAAGQAVYFEGDTAEHLYLVAMGRVKLIRDASSGHDVLLDILHGGEYFGNLKAFGGPLYNETAIAYADCCILNISSEDFEAILHRFPDVTLKLLSAVGQRLEESREQLALLSTYTVEQRIAAALLRLAGKAGEAGEQSVLIQLPLSRQDLAAMTGTTTETISRVMSRFVKEGFVRSGRKWVAVADEKGLQELIKRGAVN
jgi:CRP/FNR family transcriptional regulator, nitrogen oxide reductase regulator